VRLTSVSIVEGGPNAPEDAAVGSFELRVERSGWRLFDPLVPGIETRWSWDDISGLIATTGGHTADGEPATSLDVIVNGWPVRLVVPDDQLPDPGPLLITMLAPAGHVLRGTGLVTQAAPSHRRDDLLRLRRPGRSQMLPLCSVGTAGIGAAAAVAVMVAGTVIAAAILASGSAPSTVRHDAAPAHGSSATTVPGANGTGAVPGSVSPAVGASGGVGAVDTVPVPIVPTTTSARATSKGSGAKSNGTAAPTHSGDTTTSGAPTASTSPTTTHPSPPATTSTTKPPSTTTTTTTRPRRPPTTTTTRPTPTTTTRPPPTTTTSPPPPTTTSPPPPTTTSPPPPTTTSA